MVCLDLNSLSKILFCGADDIVFYFRFMFMSVCFVRFVLSILRQLGLVIMNVSIGLSGLASFHLLTHALFEALLFMCAGGVIHSIGDSHDIRFIGGLSVCMPFTSSCLMFSNFALCGMPFLSSFYSRDFILEMFSMKYVNVFGFLLFLSSGLTVCYYFYLFYFVICGDFNFVFS